MIQFCSWPGELGACQKPTPVIPGILALNCCPPWEPPSFRPPWNRGWRKASLFLAPLPDQHLSVDVVLALFWGGWDFLNGWSDPACLDTAQSISGFSCLWVAPEAESIPPPTFFLAYLCFLSSHHNHFSQICSFLLFPASTSVSDHLNSCVARTWKEYMQAISLFCLAPRSLWGCGKQQSAAC